MDRVVRRFSVSTKISALLVAVSSIGSIGLERRSDIDVRWIFSTFGVRPPRTGYLSERSQAIVLGDIVYVAGRSGLVTALHRELGYPLWQVSIGAGVDGSVAYGRSLLVVGDVQGTLHALNARDGSTAWTFRATSAWLSPAAIVSERVIATTSNGDIFGLTENRGEQVWRQSRTDEAKMTVHGTGAPVVFGTDVYQGFSDGVLSAYAVENGSVRWQKPLRSLERFHDIDMSVTVDSDSIYVGTFDGRSYKLGRLSGDVEWVFPVGSYGGYTLDGDRVYFSGLDKKFYALDRKSGKKIWDTQYRSGVGTTPAVIGDYLAIGTSDDPLYVLEKATGVVRGRFFLGAGSLAAVTADHEQGFLCLSNFGNLYSFSLRSSQPERQSLDILPGPSALSRRQ